MDVEFLDQTLDLLLVLSNPIQTPRKAATKSGKVSDGKMGHGSKDNSGGKITRRHMAVDRNSRPITTDALGP